MKLKLREKDGSLYLSNNNDLVLSLKSFKLISGRLRNTVKPISSNDSITYKISNDILLHNHCLFGGNE